MPRLVPTINLKEEKRRTFFILSTYVSITLINVFIQSIIHLPTIPDNEMLMKFWIGIHRFIMQCTRLVIMYDCAFINKLNKTHILRSRNH